MLGISIFGAICIVMGIVIKKQSIKIKNSKLIKGEVLSTEIRNHNIESAHVQHFESEIRFENIFGDFQIAMVKGKQPLTVGTTVDVLYDAKNDEMYLEREYKKGGIAYGNALLVIGIIFVIIGAMSIFADVEYEMLVGVILATLISSIFLVLGILLIFVKPYKTKKSLKKSDIVIGELVDYIEAGISSMDSEDSCRDDRILYAPIYEYSYKNMTYRYRSTVASTTSSRTDYGLKVSIAVNRDTGEVFCVEDEKMNLLFGVVLIIIGMLGLIGLGWLVL